LQVKSLCIAILVVVFTEEGNKEPEVDTDELIVEPQANVVVVIRFVGDLVAVVQELIVVELGRLVEAQYHIPAVIICNVGGIGLIVPDSKHRYLGMAMQGNE